MEKSSGKTEKPSAFTPLKRKVWFFKGFIMDNSAKHVHNLPLPIDVIDEPYFCFCRLVLEISKTSLNTLCSKPHLQVCTLLMKSWMLFKWVQSFFWDLFTEKIYVTVDCWCWLM